MGGQKVKKKKKKIRSRLLLQMDAEWYPEGESVPWFSFCVSQGVKVKKYYM